MELLIGLPSIIITCSTTKNTFKVKITHAVFKLTFLFLQQLPFFFRTICRLMPLRMLGSRGHNPFLTSCPVILSNMILQLTVKVTPIVHHMFLCPLPQSYTSQMSTEVLLSWSTQLSMNVTTTFISYKHIQSYWCHHYMRIKFYDLWNDWNWMDKGVGMSASGNFCADYKRKSPTKTWMII